MLRPRIIPCLLVKGGGLVKTVGFGPHKYVGDPINAVRIFNEKEVDELTVLDIDATTTGKEPNYGMIANLAAECRMPLCYGGGVTSAEQVQKIISLGVEKVAVSAGVISNPDLVQQASAKVGSQSVVVVIDVKRTGFLRRYEVFTHNGKRNTGLDPLSFAAKVEKLGAGEIVINNIDLDGQMKGYDIDLISRIRNVTTLPLTSLGGAGSIEDIRKLIQTFGIIGASAGSLFVFKGKYRAVLINYPSRGEKDALIGSARGISIQN